MSIVRRGAQPSADAQRGPGGPEAAEQPSGPLSTPFSRRRFIGTLIAGPTLIAGVQVAAPEAAAAAVPTVQPVDTYDLSDAIRDAAMPTSGMIQVVVNKDGTVSFDMPRSEVGQGISTALAMVIADELDIPLERVKVTLADARPELVFNQLTGGSTTMFTMYTPTRTAAAAARGQLMKAASAHLGVPESLLTTRDGEVVAIDGRTVSYGDLAERAAVSRTTTVAPRLKAASQQKVVGTPRKRIDALDIVTGKKQFAMDLAVPDALPTMLCRAPTINGSARAVRNLAQVKAMPGITDVAIIPHTTFVPGGVAVRGRTFGQCIDAVRALSVDWGPGTAEGKSDRSVEADLVAAELPMTPALGQTVEQRFTFHFRPGDPLETNSAIADVRPDRAEVWCALKTPVYVQEQLAGVLGLPVSKVNVHVAQGGGSFGRHLFGDPAFEAAVVSQKLGKPVKLMWHRTDNFRQGRVHPMATSRVRITYAGNQVLAFDQRHTSVATDFTHGFGELLTSAGAMPPGANSLGYSQTIFNLTASSPYNFGPTTQLLNEVYAFNTFNTSSVRNIYSPEVRTAGELMVDELARAMKMDPYQLRRSFVRDARQLAVLDAVAKAGRWGRPMAAGTAQGIAIHNEYKGRAACLLEIDCRPQTVNRKVKDAFTGPRVTKVVYAVDVGLAVNPLGLEAQMIGGIMDGIAQALTYSLHLTDGYFLEGSWDDAHYTRQWNVPPEINVIIMPPTTGEPGGAGEFGVAASMAAAACAYARATGKLPTRFPINHDLPIDFTPITQVPPIPQSPTDGLVHGAGQ